MEPEEIPHEGKLVLGALTVFSWCLFVGTYVACEEQRRATERLRHQIEDALDRDYLPAVRPETKP